MRAWILGSGPVVRRNLLLFVIVAVPVIILRGVHSSILNDPINVPKLGILLLIVPLVAALKGAELLQGGDASGLRRLLVPALALILPLTVGWLFGPYKAYSLFGNYPRFTGLIPYLVIVLFGVLVADTFRGRGHLIAWAFAGSGAIVGLYGLIQSVGLDPLEWTSRGGPVDRQAFSTLGNTNFAGGFLSIVLPVALGLFVTDRDKRKYSGPIFGLVLVGWILPQSQGAWAAGLAGVAVLGGFILSTRWNKARAAGVLVAASLAVLAVGAVVFTIVSEDRGPVPATLASRGEWWQGAAHLAAHSPFVGRGPGAYAAEGARFRTEEDARTVGFDFTDDPHSVLLSFATAAGVLGAAGVLLAAGWLLRFGLRLPDDALLPAAFFGGVIAYLVQASISIDTVALRTAFWTVAAGMVAASVPAVQVAARAGGKRVRKAVAPPLQAPFAVAALALLAAVTTLWAVNFVISDGRIHRGAIFFSQGLITEGMRQFDTAIGFRGDNRYREVYGDLLGQVALTVAQSDDPSLKAHTQEFYDKARTTFSFLDRFPDANATFEYARFIEAWATQQDPSVAPEALALYELALSRDPRNPALARAVEALRTKGIPGPGG